jgi:hypothetical protein
VFRDVTVASASAPDVFSPVLIRVENSRVPYEEMHAALWCSGHASVLAERVHSEETRMHWARIVGFGARAYGAGP